MRRIRRPRTYAAALLPWLAAFVALPAPAAAAGQQGAAADHWSGDGPPPPRPPEVVARDAQGRVTIRAVRIDEPLRIDGALDEAVYTQVRAISDFFQQEPHEGEPATEKTDVWVLFDHERVYVSARCWDSEPENIVANEMRRDSHNIFQNDNFGVILDTFHDRRNGFFFYTNAVGGLADVYVTDERDSNRDWNTVWFSRSRRFDQGWTLEMAIPFTSLRFKPAASQIWGINFRRVVRHRNEFSYLTRIPAAYGMRGMMKVSSAATLTGIEPPASRRNLELKPYAVSNLTTDRQKDPDAPDDLDGDLGFDLKYGVTESLTADFTYNTDFAQVEEDEQQINLTRFSLFFPEKREFFLEGQGIFAFGGVQTPRGFGRGGGDGETPILFFSRRIGIKGGRSVPIEVGGRLTGKAGAYSIGVLNIQTARSQPAGAVPTNFSVLRVKRDILRRSTIGFIGTSRSESLVADGSNQTFGVDASLALQENLSIVGYYARTRTPTLGGDDYSYRTRFEYSGDRYGLEIERLSVAEHFNPEVGFLRREDFAKTSAQARFSPRPRSIQAIRKINFEAGFDYITDVTGRLETRQVQGSTRVELSSGDTWSFDVDRSFEFVAVPFEVGDAEVPIGTYRFTNVRSSYQLGPQRRVSGWVNVARGGFYDGTRTDASYRGRVEINPRVSVEPGITINWIDLPQASFTTRLINARTTFTVTPQMLVAALLQYNSVADSLSTNVRFRWEYRPGSDLFVVYSDGRDTARSGFPSLVNRSLAIKMTRLFQF